MPLKIFVSPYTHRSEAEQLETCRKRPELANAPVYTPSDLTTMFRATTRRTEDDTWVVASAACIGSNKVQAEEFISGCRARKACIESVEEEFRWRSSQSTDLVIAAWKLARIEGGAAAGGKRTAEGHKARTKAAAESVRHLWRLPSRQYSIKAIEKQAGISRGALVSVLGNRGPAQHNYQAAQKRKARREAKG